jgi:rod shape-determining protein MreB
MAVTALGGMVVSHAIRVGGYDLDEAIVTALQNEQRLFVGQEQAERLKFEIGAAVAGTSVPAVAEIAGRDLATGLLRRVVVDAEQVRSALQRPLAQIVEAVKLVLERTPPELASDVATSGVTLVGGGALLPGLDQLVRRETGLTVTVAAEPLTAVVRGAGRALEQLEHFAASSARFTWRR